MKSIHIFPVAILVLLGVAPVASAQTVDEYQGKYDLMYTAVSVDLQINVTPPGYGTVAIPVVVDLALENEQVPMSVVSVLVDEAQEYLSKAGVPAKLEARIVMALETALEAAVDAINEKMVDLPDQLDLARSMPKGNLVTGTFSDLDGQGRQFALPGYLVADTGEFELSSVYYGLVDLETGTGSGLFTTGDIDVSQVVKGMKINVTGEMEADQSLTLLP